MSSALLKHTIALLFFWVCIASCIPNVLEDTSTLPVINLGYVKQRATVYNETHDWYIFKNIRFAAPPLGDLRFRKPQPPLKETEIQDGNINNTACAQTFPPFLTPGQSAITYGTEDCLFLDVYVPRNTKSTDCVPVFVWIYGGGYTIGSKDLWGDPAGLIESSDKPIIYVAINYRLGAFGWLSDSKQDIDLNAGLHDTQAAMEWIRDHISKFGGDSKRVTVVGESAGGGLIMHAITAHGGKGASPPFQQAIIQSPGFVLDRNNSVLRSAIYDYFQSAANCTNVECLRQAPTEVLISANEAIIIRQGEGGYGSFTIVVDGDYVPDVATKLLEVGKFHRNLKGIITANTAHEGAYFYPSPESVTDGLFDRTVQSYYPNASDSVLRKINELYPKGNNPVEEQQRNIEFLSDAIFNCNAQALAQAFKKKAYRYVFSVPPALHGDDVAYTFYNGPGYNPLVKSDWTATVHQEYITDFAVYGKPKCGGTSPCWIPYGHGSNTLEMNLTKVEIIRDPWNNERCDFLKDEVFKH